MATPSSFKVTPFARLTENTEFDFRGLYLRNIVFGKNPNRALLVDLNASIGWGSTSVVNWTIYDGTCPDAQLVGRARGLQVDDDGWHNSLTLAFESGRVIHGFGIEPNDQNNFKMIRKGKTSLPMLTRAGPWGGAGDYTTYKDELEESWRIQSMTIVQDQGIIAMFECTYVDLSGKRRTTGAWGASHGHRVLNKIELGPQEVLQALSGTYVDHNEETVIESLKFVTNEDEYGPYGRTTGIPFNYDVPEDRSIVGFFGRHGGKLIAIGVYMV
nr:horcolin-like [Aegilops tauschii subsp. strangulata]